MTDPNLKGAAVPTSLEPIELDVRLIPPREKHPTIFRTFDALTSGQSLLLVNDHDPASVASESRLLIWLFMIAATNWPKSSG